MSATLAISPPRDIRARLARHSRRTGACWEWTGAVRQNGYGTIGWRVGLRAVAFQVHRVSYTAFVAAIPSHLHVHHVCGNRLCIEPSHLEVLPQRDHNGVHTRTLCRRGLHSMHDAYSNGKGTRTCRHCRIASNRRYVEA